MATFTGFVNQVLELEKVVYENDVLEHNSIINNFLGTITDGIIVPYIRTFLGLYTDAFTGYIGLENKIYMQPEAFTYEIINEDIEEEIIVWNADNDGHWINNITVEGSSGIEIDLPETPFFFTPETSKIWKLKVLAEGQAMQNTKIIISWDTGQTNTIEITGSRIIPFPFEITFETYSLEHSFQTVFFNNEYFQEQRRPLSNLIKRVSEGTFLFNLKNAQDFINKVRYFCNSVLGLAIYSEPMHQILGEIQNISNIAVEETLTYYWNLSYAKYIIIINTKENYGEIKEIIGYSTDSINLKFAPVKSFLKDDTVIYPAMIGIIQNKDFEIITDKVVRANLTFKEVFL